MRKSVPRLFAEITAMLEDLQGVAVEGQRRDNGLDMQRVLLLQLRNGTAVVNGTLTSNGNGAGSEDCVTRPARPWETHYNGWSWPERCAITPVQNAMFRSGQLVRPTMCSICLFSDPARINGSGYIYAHLERYDRPAELFPTCKRCHAALHARFRDPHRWESVLRLHGRLGSWTLALTLDPASQWRPFHETYPAGLRVPSIPAPPSPGLLFQQ